MNFMPYVLSITGSDNTGASGIQADIKTISALGGYALTALTTVTVQDGQGIHDLLNLPCDTVVRQVRAIIDDCHPKTVKVGMVRDADTIAALKDEIVGCAHKVMVPGIVTSHGKRLIGDEAISAWKQKLIPEATVLLTRCNEAEILLGRPIVSDDDMLEAAYRFTDMGAGAVLIRGGHQTEGRLTAILMAEGKHQFFCSQNTEGWQRHGVGGALSAAIATHLAMGCNITTAISRAHDYLHSQVVYAVDSRVQGHRQADLYNRFMALIATYYREAHDVAFYADRLAITPRYLTRITATIVEKTPKQVIADYIMREASTLLATSRLTISEIATKLGYSSLPLFSKFFSSHQGCSPIEYRSRMSRL